MGGRRSDFMDTLWNDVSKLFLKVDDWLDYTTLQPENLFFLRKQCILYKTWILYNQHCNNRYFQMSLRKVSVADSDLDPCHFQGKALITTLIVRYRN